MGSSEETKPDVVNLSSSMMRLSVASLKIYAEAQGFPSQTLSNDAWILLWEDVNYRIRQITNLGHKFMHHSRKRQLTTEHMNKAAQLLNCQPSRGQEHWLAPKLHYMKELQIYARHEGNVNLAALALAQVTQPSIVSLSMQIEEHDLKTEVSGDDVIKVEVTPEENSEKNMALIEAVVNGVTASSKHVINFLSSANATKFVHPFMNFCISQIVNGVGNKSMWLSIVARSVCYMLKNEENHVYVGRFASKLAQILLDSIACVPMDQTWNHTFLPHVCSAIVTINRNFGDLLLCNSVSICDRLRDLLTENDSHPCVYAAALFTTLYLPCHVVKYLNVGQLLKLHYERNAPVFDCIDHFNKSDAMSIPRVIYVSLWKAATQNQLKFASLVSEDCGDVISVVESDCCKANELYNIMYFVFGDTCIYPPIALSLFPARLIEKPEDHSFAVVNLDAILTDLEEQAFSGDISTLIDNNEINMRETPPMKLNTGKHRVSSSGGGNKKRKRRTAENIFENKNRLKRRRTDFIFVFHQTEAKSRANFGQRLSSSTSSKLIEDILRFS